MRGQLPWAYFALGVAVSAVAMQVLAVKRCGADGSSGPRTTRGRAKVRGENAFVLAVELRKA